MTAAADPKSTKKKVVRKVNLLKLCAAMNKLAEDAVDKEIIKRFKILIDTSEEDISKSSLEEIFKQPENIEMSTYNEGIQPYVKHYLFMEKQDQNRKK